MATVHVKYNGEVYEINKDNLDVSDNATDAQIKTAVAQWLSGQLDTTGIQLREFVVSHETSGDINIRPEPVYGFPRACLL